MFFSRLWFVSLNNGVVRPFVLDIKKIQSIKLHIHTHTYLQYVYILDWAQHWLFLTVLSLQVRCWREDVQIVVQAALIET